MVWLASLYLLANEVACLWGSSSILSSLSGAQPIAGQSVADGRSIPPAVSPLPRPSIFFPPNAPILYFNNPFSMDAARP